MTITLTITEKTAAQLERAREYEWYQHPSDPDLWLEIDPAKGDVVTVGVDADSITIPLAAWRAFNARVEATYR